MHINEYKNKYIKYLSDEQMIAYLNLLTDKTNQAVIIYYEQETIIANQKYRELRGHYVSIVGHRKARALLVGECLGSEYTVLQPYELIFHLNDIIHMKEHNKWMVSPFIGTDIIPNSILGREPIAFD